MIKFQAGTTLTSQAMDCQVHAIGKAIDPFSQIRSSHKCFLKIVLYVYVKALPQVLHEK